MRGETVEVMTFEAVGADPFGKPTTSEVKREVENVLVCPGPCADAFENNRPEGVAVKYTLHFPKTFDMDLEGARVKVRGSWYDVIGHPDHYTLENTPGQWWMPVEVGGTHG